MLEIIMSESYPSEFFKAFISEQSAKILFKEPLNWDLLGSNTSICINMHLVNIHILEINFLIFQTFMHDLKISFVI